MRNFESLLPHILQLKSVAMPTDPHEFDEERMRSVQFQMEILPYSLGAMWHAIVQLATAQAKAMERITSSPQDNTIYSFPPEERYLMSYYIDNFLEAATRCQNSIIPYISITLSLSLPQSMRRVFRQIEEQKSPLPKSLASSIANYWAGTGKTLRDYRDLSQHFAVVASDARMYAQQGNRFMHLVLPNNPEEKKASKIVYHHPEIQALPYLIANFFSLLEVSYIVTLDLLRRKPPGKYFSMGFGIKAPITMGPNAPVKPHSVPDKEELEGLLDKNVDLLAKTSRRGPDIKFELRQ